MTTKIISIGNSRGIRLPKSVIESYELNEEIDIIIQNDDIILRKKRIPRTGWAESIETELIRRSNEDAQWLDADLNTNDSADWEWK